MEDDKDCGEANAKKAINLVAVRLLKTCKLHFLPNTTNLIVLTVKVRNDCVDSDADQDEDEAKRRSRHERELLKVEEDVDRSDVGSLWEGQSCDIED